MLPPFSGSTREHVKEIATEKSSNQYSFTASRWYLEAFLIALASLE